MMTQSIAHWVKQLINLGNEQSEYLDQKEKNSSDAPFSEMLLTSSI